MVQFCHNPDKKKNTTTKWKAPKSVLFIGDFAPSELSSCACDLTSFILIKLITLCLWIRWIRQFMVSSFHRSSIWIRYNLTQFRLRIPKIPSICKKKRSLLLSKKFLVFSFRSWKKIVQNAWKLSKDVSFFCKHFLWNGV